MNEILKALVMGEKVTDGMIEVELSKICGDVHSSCGDNCPVHEKHGGIPLTMVNVFPFKMRKECSCFKNGKAMLAFLRGKG